ncbi:hypothetical protein OG258_47835 [Streptomyces mirabilis]|uniref:hypothetical protein n=1 Tax=Streptomyces mirabilis TaxID=68239 RepID=UPI0032485754
MLLRLAYLTATNTLALLRLLPICDKGIEILALRHQPLVLQRQVGRPFADADRAALAGVGARVASSPVARTHRSREVAANSASNSVRLR